jgi:acetate kinase
MAGVTGPSPILALNCGSSSLKFGLYNIAGGTEELVCEGEVEEVGAPESMVSFKCVPTADKANHKAKIPDQAHALLHALKSLEESRQPKPRSVGHRFVHGGREVVEHSRLTPDLLEQLRTAVDYAPLHVPPALQVVETVGKQMPETPQVICFDTAFHRTMPDVSRTMPLPAKVRGMGVERYGFHGLSIESILPQLHPVPERLVVAHLGNGASITAIRKGRSVDTTMGLTPTGGIMMGTRSGDLDPGVLLFLMRSGLADSGELQDILDHKSGLLGISENTSDVRQLQKVRTADPRADLALRMFSYQVRKAVAALAAAMGGLDALVFTGGIGEHDQAMRDDVCAGLRFLSPFPILVLPAQEDLQIARITSKLLS